MKTIRILDREFKTIRFIKDAINPLIRVTLAGEYTLSFQTTVKYMDYINQNNYVQVDDELFKIQKFKNYRTTDNALYIDVYCEQVSYLLVDSNNTIHSFNYVEGEAAQSIDLSYALKTLLEGTGFTYNLDYTKSVVFQVKQSSTRRKILLDMAVAFGKEVEFHKFDITLKDKIGSDNGVQFRVGKNLQGISKEVDDTNRDKYGNPSIAYEFDVVDLSDKYPFEKAHIGDTVKVIDDGIKINLKARVIEKEYNPVNSTTSKTVLANVVRDLADYSVSVENQINETNDQIIDTNVKINKTSEALKLDIQQTNEALTITAQNLKDSNNQLNSKIDITAQSLTSDYSQKITDANNRISQNESKITQTASEIRSEVSQQISSVNGVVSSLSSTITQQANKISMVVDGGGNINAASITAAIVNNQSSINLIADHISLQPKSNVIDFPNGCSVDCNGSVARLRQNQYNYLYVDGQGLTVYVRGTIIAYITTSGIYWMGQRVFPK